MSYDYLTEFATASQLDKLAALRKHGSMRAAAKAMGIDHSNFCKTIKALKKKAALRGVSPEHDWTKAVPPTHIAKGVSSYYNKDGQLAGQWVKADVDKDQREAIVREAIAELSSSVKGLAPIAKPPKKTLESLLAVYPMGDPHFGMYAWAEEAGDDFDTDKARDITLAAVDRLVNAAPAASTAILIPLGDVFHADDTTHQTPAHKHALDVDSRYVRVLRIGIATYRHAILRMKEKHGRVIVRFVGGNHDPHAVWALALTISAYFESDPCIAVDLSPAAHWFYKHGKTLIGATHGDKSRHEQLPGIMAADRAEWWGQTRHRYWLTGHVHHQSVKEFPGVVCESFRTLAAKDAYAAGYGYRAGRDMLCIVYDSEHGEVERHRCDIGMIEGNK
jgi:hypothetical protein